MPFPDLSAPLPPDPGQPDATMEVSTSSLTITELLETRSALEEARADIAGNEATIRALSLENDAITAQVAQAAATVTEIEHRIQRAQDVLAGRA